MRDAFASALLRILEASQNEVGISRSSATRIFLENCEGFIRIGASGSAWQSRRYNSSVMTQYMSMDDTYVPMPPTFSLPSLFCGAFLVNGPEVQYVVKRQASRAIGDELCRFVGQQ